MVKFQEKLEEIRIMGFKYYFLKTLFMVSTLLCIVGVPVSVMLSPKGVL